MVNRAPNGRILCTEDDSDTRDLLAFALQLQGYEVICTGDPEEALILAKNETFDLLLSDSIEGEEESGCRIELGLHLPGPRSHQTTPDAR